MTGALDQDTALERRDDGWHGTVSDRFQIIAGPNGGYLAALLLRSLMLESPQPDPLSMTVHYLQRPDVPQPARLRVEVLREGRAHATLETRLEQDAGTVAVALATFGRLREGGGQSVQGAMPDVPPPDECEPLAKAPFPATFFDRVEHRVPPSATPFYALPPGSPAVSGGWTRLPDRPIDALAVPLLMDSWPPAMFFTYGGGSSPTIELTVHWRSQPGEGWHLLQFRSRFFMGGYVEEDGELWSQDGRLVAQSRQLARFVPPAG